MDGNTTTVMIGLGLVCLVLPIGLLILFLSNRTIEREHPSDVGPALPQGSPAAGIPGQRPAPQAETSERASAAPADRVAAGG